MSGVVYLVGAGPGDPGLLTLRGAELLKRAEVLVHDHLAAPEIMALAPKHCRRVYVGKEAGNHALPQQEINRLLVTEARAGRTVVRLKGGDPYIFGRGGEEAQALAKAGVPFEVVPGISSTVAAAAYAGIPLTHRDFNSQTAFAAGHERPDKPGSAHDWAALARMGSLAMVMGVKNLDGNCRALIAAGRAADTPAALIQWGTTSRQRTVTATLADLAAKAEAARISPPALLVVGEVVTLRDQLNWFETRPLFGRRILVTRSRERAGRLSSALAELGAEVWERPTIAFEPLDDTLVKSVMRGLADYQWLIFTSPAGAEIFLKALFDSGRDARALGGLRIAVIGPGTAEVLKSFGLMSDLVPRAYVAEGLLEALLSCGLQGKRILLARAMEGRDVLPEGLAAAGAQVIDLPLYTTVNPVWEEPLPGPPDLVTLTSSSTAAGLAGLIPLAERKNYPAASMGPITSRTARELGFPVVVEARESTVAGLAQAAVRWFAQSPGSGGGPR